MMELRRFITMDKTLESLPVVEPKFSADFPDFSYGAFKAMSGEYCATDMWKYTRRSTFQKPGDNHKAKALWVLREAKTNGTGNCDWSSERQIVSRTPQRCGRVSKNETTDGEHYIWILTDPGKNNAPRSEEEHEVYNQVLDSVCAKFGKYLDNHKISRSKLRSGATFTSACLRASFWLSKDHKDLKRMAMNRSFPSTQDLMQSVQQQVQNTERTQRCIQCAGIRRTGRQIVGQELRC